MTTIDGTSRSVARQAVMRTTLDELSTMLSADGAALSIVALGDDAVELAIELDSIECADCVLPPDQLRSTIVAALARDTGEAIAVVVHDPRAIDVGAPTVRASPSSGGFVVLDPTGVAPDGGRPDAGPDAGPLAGKTVAIRHDVLWPAFDWTVEEWKLALEGYGATVLMWPRAQGEKDDVLAVADAELDAMLARSDLAISGLANCGSCTSWSVRDAIVAADKGLPTTVVATAHFEQLAHMLAAEYGRPGLRVTVLPYPYSTLPEHLVREHARAAVPHLLHVLGASVAAGGGA
jgi:hypothetical protein